MKRFAVCCHPSRDSFTCRVKDTFPEALTDVGHEVMLSDLYAGVR